MPFEVLANVGSWGSSGSTNYCVSDLIAFIDQASKNGGIPPRSLNWMVRCKENLEKRYNEQNILNLRLSNNNVINDIAQCFLETLEDSYAGTSASNNTSYSQGSNIPRGIKRKRSREEDSNDKGEDNDRKGKREPDSVQRDDFSPIKSRKLARPPLRENRALSREITKGEQLAPLPVQTDTSEQEDIAFINQIKGKIQERYQHYCSHVEKVISEGGIGEIISDFNNKMKEISVQHRKILSSSDSNSSKRRKILALKFQCERQYDDCIFNITCQNRTLRRNLHPLTPPLNSSKFYNFRKEIEDEINKRIKLKPNSKVLRDWPVELYNYCGRYFNIDNFKDFIEKKKKEHHQSNEELTEKCKIKYEQLINEITESYKAHSTEKHSNNKNSVKLAMKELEIDHLDQDTVKKAYRKLSLKHHPDRTTDEKEKILFTEKFKAINTAFTYLSDLFKDIFL